MKFPTSFAEHRHRVRSHDKLIASDDIHVASALQHQALPVKSLNSSFAKMVLDIDQFRPEKGGNPDKIRENQRLRFSDVSMVDKIVQADENWRKGIS